MVRAEGVPRRSWQLPTAVHGPKPYDTDIQIVEMREPKGRLFGCEFGDAVKPDGSRLAELLVELIQRRWMGKAIHRNRAKHHRPPNAAARRCALDHIDSSTDVHVDDRARLPPLALLVRRQCCTVNDLFDGIDSKRIFDVRR